METCKLSIDFIDEDHHPPSSSIGTRKTQSLSDSPSQDIHTHVEHLSTGKVITQVVYLLHVKAAFVLGLLTLFSAFLLGHSSRGSYQIQNVLNNRTSP